MAWRFPDWTAVGFRVEPSHAPEGARTGSREATSRSRTRFLGSRAFRRPLPAGLVALGPACRLSRVSHPAVRHATGGDINPDCLAGVFAPRGVADVAGRRFRPCPPLLASHGSFFGTGLRIRSLFQFRRSLSCPTTRGNIQFIRGFTEEKHFPVGRISTAMRNPRNRMILTGA